MKIKLIHRYYRLSPPNPGVYEPGQIIEVDENTAKQMIAQQTAELAPEEVKEIVQ